MKKIIIDDSGQVIEVELTSEELAELTARAEAAANSPPPVPQSVTNFQGRAILRIRGIFDDVEAAIEAISDPVVQKAVAREAFERADFNRNSPFLIGVATGLGMTDADIDQLFRDAANIKL